MDAEMPGARFGGTAMTSTEKCHFNARLLQQPDSPRPSRTSNRLLSSPCGPYQSPPSVITPSTPSTTTLIAARRLR